MSKLHSFYFYADDWLSSPTIAMMSLEEQGAYIRLLAYCWQDKNCSLPCDPTRLGNMSLLDVSYWEGWVPGNEENGSRLLHACFIKHPTLENRVTNFKLFQQWEKASKWIEKSSKGGKKSQKEQRSSRVKRTNQTTRVVQKCFKPNDKGGSPTPIPIPIPTPSPPSVLSAVGGPGGQARPNEDFEGILGPPPEEHNSPEPPSKLMAESVKEVLNETKRREWFNEFWTLYPNPREKQTCWLNFYRMFEEETHRRIMKAVEQQIEQDENFTKENGRFALASHKYLADRQWEVWERKQKAGYPGRPDLGTYEERVARRLAEEQSKQQKEFENMIAESSRRLAEKEKGKKR